jgi:diguanylate cyclase (GGDEF)-like protein
LRYLKIRRSFKFELLAQSFIHTPLAGWNHLVAKGRSGMAQSAWNTVLVTLVAVLGSSLVSLSTRFAIHQEITLLEWVLTMGVPVLIACPLSFWFFHSARRLERANKELERRANQDQMTGLWNRASFFRRLGQIEQAALSYGLLVIDVDHFKLINDTFGHAEGDRALIAVAGALTAATRRTDFVARVGGEEFAVIVIGSNHVESSLVADRIRSGVETLCWTTLDARNVSLTVSIGGTISREGAAAQDLLRQADERLYDAKKSGRNRVVWGPVAAEPAFS